MKQDTKQDTKQDMKQDTASAATSTPTVQAGILGAAGYTGGELLRLLAHHPRVQVRSVASSTWPDQPVHRAHPHLRGCSDLVFTRELDVGDLDCVFLAGGHGVAMAQVPELLRRRPHLRLIDLSGDFRLHDPDAYPRWYDREHTAPELLSRFVYGLPELDRAAVSGAQLVANPGCFATACALALAPLARAGLTGTVHVTAMTGSSGSGAQPSATTHHPTRATDLHAYKPLRHQHVPEIEQLLDRVAGKPSLRVALVPVSAPLVRGIYAVAQLELPDGWNAERVRAAFASTYAGCAFVRLLDTTPSLNAIVGSNFCDVFSSVEGRRVVIIAALDNLVKGAAGQAIQNLNVMLGWNETTGLLFPGLHP
jgi:N-acetyl-gamma-glutamyl-phosphate reductase